ncbi:clathrin-adaptor gamma chain Ap1g1 [Dictyostelium purpureum]|uniref:AP-1 complex subunit gamma n=1 Tax=Dictyostelium purpureum TaxID=5786 RepID=F0ZP90_DICPU|nr:clathrin-adaptor gamma chain Ap1g1 [Dictyostelium purpureum]EGC34223.1 clathrin-adaptor gamma chain Ap1g1 [Dictyostelium purpureum]|eukprot:XP_003289233.1 clathrin-adaptor gamma chain Ap1g1 [Dictyostelium purpureum]
MSIKLRDLIKTVRSCKTAAEERAQIAKESAQIRTAMKEEDVESRQRNVAKLLYIHMLGYATQFGQMECLKLIVSPSYADKRIGYLGLMLLLDEKQEVLLLATNCIRGDFVNPNQFIVGVALCAFGNICSSMMARDCSLDIEQLFPHSNPYIRKKAALCAIRVLRKVPDLIENYIPKIKALLSERNHGVILTALTLIIEICEMDSQQIVHFKKMVPQLVRILKSLTSSGYLPEHDIGGVTDPFLQVKILRLLRILGHNDPESSDLMNDILAQVATNTDSTKNVGNAILYECVQTIMSIESENGLKVMAINILGRFLLNRDNNIRYVALNTLSRVVNTDIQAVQRHRNTIVECLKDPDVSIRCRALDLIYSLVTESNIRVLVRELLNFLLIADAQFKSELVAKLCIVTEKYAPNKRWQIDTILRVMSIAGNFIPDEVPSNLIQLISSTPELSSYAVQKLYLALKQDITQQPLTQVGLWCIGEYGDLLVADKSQLPKDEEGLAINVTEQNVIDLVDSIFKHATTTQSTRQYSLTSLAKLSSRFSQNSLLRVKSMIDFYKQNINLELQQRACEYSTLFDFDKKASILDRMPPIEKQEVESPLQTKQIPTQTPPTPHQQQPPSQQQNQQSGGFGSLLDGLDSPTTSSQNASNGQKPQNAMSLLEDIFGPSPVAQTSPQQNMNQMNNNFMNMNMNANTNTTNTNNNNNNNSGTALLDLMSGIMPTPSPQQSQPQSQPQTLSPNSGGGLLQPVPQPLSFPAFQKHGLEISYECTKPQPNNLSLTNINMIITNTGPSPITNFSLQAAVPKYLKIQLLAPSSTTIPPNGSGEVTQFSKVLNSQQGQKPILLRVKLDFQINGQAYSEVTDTPLPSLF